VAILNAGPPRAPPSTAAAAKAEASKLVARLGGRIIAAPKDEVGGRRARPPRPSPAAPAGAPLETPRPYKPLHSTPPAPPSALLPPHQSTRSTPYPPTQGDLYIASYRDHKPDAYALAESQGRPVFDVVHVDWLRECEAARELVHVRCADAPRARAPLASPCTCTHLATQAPSTLLIPPTRPHASPPHPRPAHYFFLSQATRTAEGADMDIHGVPISRDVDASDVRQVRRGKRRRPGAAGLAVVAALGRGLPSSQPPLFCVSAAVPPTFATPPAPFPAAPLRSWSTSWTAARWRPPSRAAAAAPRTPQRRAAPHRPPRRRPTPAAAPAAAAASRWHRRCP
jgi:hypothetical protein